MVHALKIRKEFFEEISAGNKRYEIRKNDRDFCKDDLLALNEIDADGNYTGRHIFAYITHVLSDTEFLQPNFVLLSISKINMKYPDAYRTNELKEK